MKIKIRRGQARFYSMAENMASRILFLKRSVVGYREKQWAESDPARRKELDLSIRFDEAQQAELEEWLSILLRDSVLHNQEVLESLGWKFVKVGRSWSFTNPGCSGFYLKKGSIRAAVHKAADIEGIYQVRCLSPHAYDQKRSKEESIFEDLFGEAILPEKITITMDEETKKKIQDKIREIKSS